jgi:hypothetical protein
MNEEIAKFLTLLISATITATLPILIGFLVAWLNKKLAQAKVALTVDQQRLIMTSLKMLVDAAEQSGLWNTLLAEGKDKKQWVIDQATSWLTANNLPIDLPFLAAQVESIIKSMNDTEDDQAVQQAVALDLVATPETADLPPRKQVLVPIPYADDAVLTDEHAALLTEAYEKGVADAKAGKSPDLRY